MYTFIYIYIYIYIHTYTYTSNVSRLQRRAQWEVALKRITQQQLS